MGNLNDAVQQYVEQRYAPGSIRTPGDAALAKVNALIALLDGPGPVPALSSARLAAMGIKIETLEPGEQPVPFTVPTAEVAGYLKDGTPVYFGRAKPENYGSSEPR